MDIELEFISEGDGTARKKFIMDSTAASVTLPSVVVINRSGRHLVIPAALVTPVDPGNGQADRLSELWRPVVPQPGLDLAEHGRYRAPWRHVPGAALPPGRTGFIWSVEIAERLSDDSLRPLGTVQRKCLLVVPPVGPAEPTPASTTQPAAASAVASHDGWLAIDFGMSNSTITMFDQNQKRALVGIPPTQTAVLRERLADLLNGACADGLGLPADQWRPILEAAGRTLAAVLPDGHAVDPLIQVKESLVGDGVFDVLLALEQEVGNAISPQREALVGALQRLYLEAFNRPPIEELQLVPVTLHAGEEAISSDAHVLSLSPLRVAMWADGDTGTDDSVPLAVEHQPGLKRFLGNPRLLPGLLPSAGTDGPTTDDALTALWQCLLSKVSEFRQRHGERYSRGQINRAVVTYPTTAPPQTRIDMERLAQSVGLRIVDTRFDEATAAAMFYLMRDFAGDHAVGIETFRARSREVAPGVWHYNILVIDVGGGSTDVALLGLTLRDRTDPESAVPADQQGRYYELRPTVLGKAGDLQLGGDRITLGIFHLLKAKIADRLLTESPGLVVGEYPPYLENGAYVTGSLLAATASGTGTSTEVTRSDLIDQVVPTRWSLARAGAEERAVRERFGRLWDEAEKAKRGAAAENRPYLLRNLDDLLQLDSAQAQPSPIEVGHAEVRAEIDKVLRRSVNIGLDVARKRLPTDATGGNEPLDTVILSGGTSALPRARQLLHEVFTEETTQHGRGSLGWNPLRVVYDPAFAKLGTSIGACWAEHIHQKGFTDPRQAKRHVAMGRTEIHIDVDNLFHGLPYGLDLSGQGANTLPVFRPGEEFERVGESGQGALRSSWMPAIPDLAISRRGYSADEPAARWGHLSLQELHLNEDPSALFDFNEWISRVMVQFEIGEADRLTAHFCAGRPHYSLDMSECPQDHHVAVREETDGRARLCHELLVNPDAAGGLANHGRVLLRQDAEPDGYVVSPGDPNAVACWISRRFPRELPADGSWWIGRRDANDPTTMHRVGTPIRAGVRYGRGADTRIVVDALGRVQAVQGFVPYLSARSMTEVVDRPGSVLSVRMNPGKLDLDGRFDPFNGTH